MIRSWLAAAQVWVALIAPACGSSESTGSAGESAARLAALEKHVQEVARAVRGFEKRWARIEGAPSASAGAAEPGDVAAPAQASGSGARERDVALARSGVPAAEREAIAALQKAADPARRAELASGLLSSPFPGARLSGLLELLETEPQRGLSEMRSLVEALDPDEEANSWGLAEAAILALAELEGSAADAELYRYYESEELMVQVPAARALELRGDSSPMQALLRKLAAGLASEKPRERIQAVTDMARTRSALALAALAPAFEDPDPEVRLRAAAGLARIGGEPAVAIARSLLADESPAVREAAEKALEALREAEASAPRR